MNFINEKYNLSKSILKKKSEINILQSHPQPPLQLNVVNNQNGNFLPFIKISKSFKGNSKVRVSMIKPMRKEKNKSIVNTSKNNQISILQRLVKPREDLFKIEQSIRQTYSRKVIKNMTNNMLLIKINQLLNNQPTSYKLNFIERMVNDNSIEYLTKYYTEIKSSVLLKHLTKYYKENKLYYPFFIDEEINKILYKNLFSKQMIINRQVCKGNDKNMSKLIFYETDNYNKLNFFDDFIENSIEKSGNEILKSGNDYEKTGIIRKSPLKNKNFHNEKSCKISTNDSFSEIENFIKVLNMYEIKKKYTK